MAIDNLVRDKNKESLSQLRRLIWDTAMQAEFVQRPIQISWFHFLDHINELRKQTIGAERRSFVVRGDDLWPVSHKTCGLQNRADFDRMLRFFHDRGDIFAHFGPRGCEHVLLHPLLLELAVRRLMPLRGDRRRTLVTKETVLCCLRSLVDDPEPLFMMLQDLGILLRWDDKFCFLPHNLPEFQPAHSSQLSSAAHSSQLSSDAEISQSSSAAEISHSSSAAHSSHSSSAAEIIAEIARIKVSIQLFMNSVQNVSSSISSLSSPSEYDWLQPQENAVCPGLESEIVGPWIEVDAQEAFAARFDFRGFDPRPIFQRLLVSSDFDRLRICRDAARLKDKEGAPFALLIGPDWRMWLRTAEQDEYRLLDLLFHLDTLLSDICKCHFPYAGFRSQVRQFCSCIFLEICDKNCTRAQSSLYMYM